MVVAVVVIRLRILVVVFVMKARIVVVVNCKGCAELSNCKQYIILLCFKTFFVLSNSISLFSHCKIANLFINNTAAGKV